ncbi:MAG: TonB-dependent receptor, partial [Bacteroidetes bacterium]|nr:TonB-dependent receptor [Bacteroidota bacterium]
SDGAFKWLAGLYYDKADDEIKYEMKSDMPGMSGVTRQDIKGNSYSAFAHASYPITGQLSLSGGIRYDKEDKEFKDYIHPLELDESWEVISPKIALEYSINPDVMVYISASKGSRSGGFNPHTPDPAFNNYDQEELWSYEIGEKITLFDSRLTLNGSVYYMDISDMQVQEAVSPIETYLTNAATATGKGFELEIMAKVYKGLDIMAGYGYSDVEFDEFKDMLGDYKGNTNPFAPKYSCNFGVQYRHKNGYYARADLIGYGKMYLDKANEYSRDAYEIVNAKIGYEAEHFDIYLYGKNLFDKEYNTEGYFGGSYTIYSEPREIGAKLVYRF